MFSKHLGNECGFYDQVISFLTVLKSTNLELVAFEKLNSSQTPLVNQLEATRHELCWVTITPCDLALGLVALSCPGRKARTIPGNCGITDSVQIESVCVCVFYFLESPSSYTC